MRVTWLAEVLREAGLTVVEHGGWQNRGWQPWEPRFGIAHATAAPRTQSDQQQVAIVRDGHSTLPGPIANCCVDRQGRWHVLAASGCNTALVGWAGPAKGIGNSGLLGVEACNDNRGEPWPAAQLDAYARGWAAICRRLGWSASKVVGHKEHQPNDKSDPSFSMTTFRTRIDHYLKEPNVTGPSAKEIAKAVWQEVIEHSSNSARYWPGEQGKSAKSWQRSHGIGIQKLQAMVDRNLALSQALLAAVTSDGDLNAILARVDAHHAEQMAAVAELERRLTRAEAERAELAELVRQAQAGAIPMDQLLQELDTRLADPGETDGS
jgi:hypothetical protein